MHNTKKTEIVILRIPTEEKAALRRRAKANHQSMSAYVRASINNRPADNPKLLLEYQKQLTQLGKIGNNINQIVRAHNSGLYRSEDRAELCMAMQQVSSIMQEIRDSFFKFSREGR